MDVRVVRFIMKRGVPFQMIGVDFKVFGKLERLGGEQGFPCAGVVVVQPGRILAAQGNDGCSYVSCV
jgi:hypothetical protein